MHSCVGVRQECDLCSESDKCSSMFPHDTGQSWLAGKSMGYGHKVAFSTGFIFEVFIE